MLLSSYPPTGIWREMVYGSWHPLDVSLFHHIIPHDYSELDCYSFHGQCCPKIVLALYLLLL